MKQAEADADSLIVSNVLFLAESGQPVIVVGTDIYLLLMMVARATEDMVLHMLFCENPTTPYTDSSVQDLTQASNGETSKYILVLHAITGCDTMSAVFHQEKQRAFNLVHKKKEYDLLKVFLSA